MQPKAITVLQEKGQIMVLIFKIAFRNIMRHKGKSIVIGLILFIGALLMTVGNGIVSGMNAGLQKNIVEGFCGDAVLVSESQQSDNLFLDFMGKPLVAINNYKVIDSTLKTIPSVKKWLPIGKNMAGALNEEGGFADGAFLIGVDMKKYHDFFGDNLKVVEGRLLNDGEIGALIPTGWRKDFVQKSSILYATEKSPIDTSTISAVTVQHLKDLTIKNDIVYMGMNADNSSTDVRLPVVGVIKYRSLNSIWGNFPIVDIESYRKCLGYFSSAEKSVPTKKEDIELLAKADASLDDLFANDVVYSAASSKSSSALLVPGSLVEKIDTTMKKQTDSNNGAFNLVLLRLNIGNSLNKTVQALNSKLKQKNLGVKVVPWNKATGMVGSMALLIKCSLFAFVMLLYVVAILIIINTLSMAALERTSEIGMMRAVGARKGFIRNMFLGETVALSVIFGGAGIAVGLIIVNILAALNLTTANDMMQLLYGGDTFRPLLNIVDIALAAVQLCIVTVLAVIYPMYVASNITPLDAIGRE
jgi:putative ABC transport system permease protein